MLDDEFFDCWEAVTKSEMSSSSGGGSDHESGFDEFFECLEPVAKTSFSWQYLLELQRLLNAVDLGKLNLDEVDMRMFSFGSGRGKRSRIRKLKKPAVHWKIGLGWGWGWSEGWI